VVIDRAVASALDSILKIDRVLSIVISSYDGLLIFEKGVEAVNRKKFSVEVAKVAKTIKVHLPTHVKEGIMLSIYYQKYEVVIGFFEKFIVSSLCDRNVNMGVLKIKMRKIIPQLQVAL
jgi:predicted regulator of Ras-like GTPase activity (Roadblock/LC7/MglB family)